MNLYELSGNYKALYENLDDIDLNDENGQEMLTAYFDTLEALEGEFEQKAENIAVWCKELEYQKNALEQEKKAISDRIKQKQTKADSLKRYLLERMEEIGRTKIDTPKAVISVRNNAESVQIDNPAAFIEWAERNRDDLLKFKEPEINKTALKKEMQNGLCISGVSLVRNKSLVLK